MMACTNKKYEIGWMIENLLTQNETTLELNLHQKSYVPGSPFFFELKITWFFKQMPLLFNPYTVFF